MRGGGKGEGKGEGTRDGLVQRGKRAVIYVLMKSYIVIRRNVSVEIYSVSFTFR